MDAAQRAREAQAADLIAQAERDNRARLERAAAAADAAVVEANARAAAAERTAKELRNDLAKTTSSSRACLSGAAVGLLNASSGASGSGMRMPETTTGSGSTASAASTDSGQLAASERDIAEWIVTARSMYETCVARIDALRQWAESQEK